jgi:hypothetical protein
MEKVLDGFAGTGARLARDSTAAKAALGEDGEVQAAHQLT